MAEYIGVVPKENLINVPLPFAVGRTAVQHDVLRDQVRFLNELTSRTWIGYKDKQEGVPQEYWDSVVKRFGVTDLVTPALNCIVGATMGGRVIRRVTASYGGVSVDWLNEVFSSPEWHRRWSLFCRDRILYGNGYAFMTLTDGLKWGARMLPPVNTYITTDVEDVENVLDIRTEWKRTDGTCYWKVYRTDGVWTLEGERADHDSESDVGFMPVVHGKSTQICSTSPYGWPLLMAAGDESKQTTALSNDIMVLAKTQSFSILVEQGSGGAEVERVGPHTKINVTDPNGKVYYITPDAKISEMDQVNDRKFERAAAQSNVPVDIYCQPRSGTGQKSGAALLSYKPLFDLACGLQAGQREAEVEALAMLNALALMQTHGRADEVVDLGKVRAGLEASIEFVDTMKPLVTSEDVQAHKLAVDSSLVDFEDSRAYFNPTDTPEAVDKARTRYEEGRKVAAMSGLPV